MSKPTKPVYSASFAGGSAVKLGGATRLRGVHFYNPNASVVYVQFFDLESPTLGTTTPRFSLAIPAQSPLYHTFPEPIEFGVAFTLAVTTEAENATAPASALHACGWVEA